MILESIECLLCARHCVTANEVNNIISPILQVRKLRLREIVSCLGSLDQSVVETNTEWRSV